MNFLQPAFFWAFLSLIPLAAIYLLKVRPTRKPTTAYFLWRTLFQEKRSTRLFHRLRDLFSLLLMALAVSAVVVAMTGPEWAGAKRKDLLLIIDRSASMSAMNEGPSRLARALELSRDIVIALDGNQRAAIATIDQELAYQAHFTNDPRGLVEAIERITPSSLPFRREALDSVSSSETGDHRVLLLSDGGSYEPALEGIELLKVGSPQRNVGIVRCDLQLLPGAGRPLGFYFQIASSYPETIAVDLALSHETPDNIVKMIPLSIEPGLNAPETYTVENGTAGRWLARLVAPTTDGLTTDDVAYLQVASPRPIRVTVNAENPYFYRHTVLAFAQASGLLTLDDANPELVIADGRVPDADLSVVFRPNGESTWWESVGEEIDGVVPRVLAKDHPALRHCDVSTISFVGSRELEAPQGALVLVATEQGIPLIYRARQAGKTAVVVNIDPSASNFYFSAWFPVLVYSAATHLGGRENTVAATYPAGATLPIPGFQEGEKSILRSPEGQELLAATSFWGPAREIGFYEVAGPSGDWLLGTSLLATAETMLDNSAVTDTSQPLRRGNSLGFLLTILAILVLVTESVLYHRRKVG